MSNKEKGIVKKESAFVQKVSKQIAITNKLLVSANENLAKENLAKEYFEKGNECYRKNEFERAISNYTIAIEMERERVTDFSELKFNALTNRAKAKYKTDDDEGGRRDIIIANLESKKSGGPNSPWH